MNDSVRLPIARLTFSEAVELANLIAVGQDLHFVEQACDRLVQCLRNPVQDPVLQRSYFTAALIAYVRCFSTGRRYSLKPDIFASLPGEPLSVHQHHKDTRDKHIAHSVNPFEEIQIGAVMTPPGTEPQAVQGIVHFVASLVAFDEEGVLQLFEMARFARSWVENKVQELNEQVFEIACNEDVQALATSEGLRFTAQGGAEASSAKRDA